MVLGIKEQHIEEVTQINEIKSGKQKLVHTVRQGFIFRKDVDEEYRSVFKERLSNIKGNAYGHGQIDEIGPNSVVHGDRY